MSQRETREAVSYLEDPRVFFAAERTLLAWQRTAIAIIGMGFVIGRFGVSPFISDTEFTHGHSRASLVLAIAFLLCGAVMAQVSSAQYRRFIKDLSAPELPRGHMTWLGPTMNLVLTVAAVAMASWFIVSAEIF